MKLLPSRHYVKEDAGDHEAVAEEYVNEMGLSRVHPFLKVVYIHVCCFEQDVKVVDCASGIAVNIVKARE